jgi:hypothetical protein
MSRFFSFFLIAFFVTCSISRADDDIYVVENIEASVTAKTPTDARILATTAARKDAFLVLLARLNLDLAIADNLGVSEIADMVKSEQINNEKIAGNNYSAMFNISFAKNFVDHILSQKDTKKVEVKLGAILLVPVKNDGNKLLLWEKENDWKVAVEKALEKMKQKKFVVLEGDLENIAVINSGNVAQINSQQLDPLFLRYSGNGIYILTFSFDDIENKAVIDVSYVKKLQKIQSRFGFVNVERLGKTALLDRVANKVMDHILKSQAADSQVSNLVKIEIINSRFDGWLMVKNKIENSNLVSSVNIDSLSGDRATVSVNYVNSEVNIVDAFAKIGLVLEKKSDNSYKILMN